MAREMILLSLLCHSMLNAALADSTANTNGLYPVYPTSFLKRDGTSHHSSHHNGGTSGGGSASYHAPDTGYAQPAVPPASYSPPSPSYSAPSPGYSSPGVAANYAAPSYNEPADGYTAGDTGYQTSASYNAPAAPSYGADEGFGIDLISLIIPGLAILGLSLLFPTVVSLSTTKRKRRSTDEDADIMVGETEEGMLVKWETVRKIVHQINKSRFLGEVQN